MIAIETLMSDHSHAAGAAACHISPHMPAFGMAAGTPVLTLSGVIPVDYIAPGDKLITRSGARVVTAIAIAVVRDARVICICEAVLGKDRPEADIRVAPHQPLLIRDWRAKALAGLDQAVMQADRLVDGHYIQAETLAEVRMITLHFAQPQVIFAAGLELACTTTPAED